MTEVSIDDSGHYMPRRNSSSRNAIEKELAERWERATHERMPVWVEELPLHMKAKAVALAESGDTPFIPPLLPISQGDSVVQTNSMQEWDAHKQ